MIKRTLFWLLAAVVALAALVGVEIVLALRREYLPTEPVLDVSGQFGAPNRTPLHFVVLGDSTSAGVGAGTAENAYPWTLAERLAEEGRYVTLETFGVSGARVGDVLSDQVAKAVAANPDLIFVGIGANDVVHLTSLDDVRRDFAEILDRLKETGAELVVAGPPDMRAAAWHEPLRSLSGWRGRIVASEMGEVARDRGITVVPLAEITGPFFTEDGDAAYSGDLFHPGVRGYGHWADAIYPYLRDALADGSASG